MARQLSPLLILLPAVVLGVEIFPHYQDVIIQENVGTVTLPCSYRSTGSVRPETIRWTVGDRNGRVVFSVDEFRNEQPGSRFSGRVRLGNGADLILSQPTVSDSATYVCTVTVPMDTRPSASGSVILVITECVVPDTVSVGICVTLDIILIASGILWFFLSTRTRIIHVKLYRRILRLVAGVSLLSCTASVIVLLVYVTRECVQALFRLRVAGIVFCVLGLLLGILSWLLTARRLRAADGTRSSTYDPDDDLESATAQKQNGPISNKQAMLSHQGSSSGPASPTDKVAQGDFPPDIDKAVYDDMVKILPNRDSGQRLRRFEELRTREVPPSQLDRYLPEPMEIADYNSERSPISNGPDEVFYPPRTPSSVTRPGREDRRDLSREQPVTSSRAPSTSAVPQVAKANTPKPNDVTSRPIQNHTDKKPKPNQAPVEFSRNSTSDRHLAPPTKALLSLPPTGHPVPLRDKSSMKKARSEEFLKRGLSLPVLNVERRSLPLSIEEKIDQDIFLEDCRQTVDYFIETSAYRKLENYLNHKDTKGVTVTGGPGSGKTATAMYAAWKLHTTAGFLPLKVSTIAEIERIYIEGLKLVFVVDDPFGKLCASSELQQYWISSAKRLQACLSTDNVKIIATVRSGIWTACRFSVMRYPPFSSSVEMSGKLSLEERRIMLSRHLSLAGVNTSEASWEATIRQITQPGANSRFPLCCQLVRTSDNFRHSATELFQKPTALMRKNMRSLRREDPASFCVLALILAHGCKLSRTILHRPLNDLPQLEREKIETIWQLCGKKATSAPPSPEEFEKKVDNLCKIYIVKAETSLEFAMTSFAEVTLLEMASLSIDLVLRWCHPDVIAGKLVPEGCPLTDSMTPQTIVQVSPAHWPQLASLLTSELLGGNIKPILDNPAWGSTDFIASWKEHVVTDSVRQKLLSVSGSCSQGEIVHRAAHQGLLSLLHVLLHDVTLGKNGVRLHNEYGQSLLHSAAIGGQMKTVQYLLDKGCPVDATNDAGESPLYVTSLQGHEHIVELLLTNQADPDKPNKLGLRPLHAAVFGEHTEVVSILSARVSEESLGSYSRSRIGITSFRDKFLSTLKHTGLHEAARTSDLVRIHHLLDNGFDKNAENKYGWSPLYISVMLGHVEAAALLLTRGANPNTATHRGTAPLDEACAAFSDPLVALLLSYGTKRSSCV